MAQDRLSKKQQYDFEKKRKEEEKRRAGQVRALKKRIVLGAAAGGVLLLGVLFLRQIDFGSSSQSDELIAANGIHWHAHLSIKILGEEQEVPAGIGIGAVHNPVHTHDPDGVIHMEFPGRVTASQVRLARFFEVWGKRFNRDCIFEKCNGEEGRVKMFVNGKENFDFENYVMRDGDRIEIVFEK